MLVRSLLFSPLGITLPLYYIRNLCTRSNGDCQHFLVLIIGTYFLVPTGAQIKIGTYILFPSGGLIMILLCGAKFSSKNSCKIVKIELN